MILLNTGFPSTIRRVLLPTTSDETHSQSLSILSFIGELTLEFRRKIKDKRATVASG